MRILGALLTVVLFQPSLSILASSIKSRSWAVMLVRTRTDQTLARVAAVIRVPLLLVGGVVVSAQPPKKSAVANVLFLHIQPQIFHTLLIHIRQFRTISITSHLTQLFKPCLTTSIMAPSTRLLFKQMHVSYLRMPTLVKGTCLARCLLPKKS